MPLKVQKHAISNTHVSTKSFADQLVPVRFLTKKTVSRLVLCIKDQTGDMESEPLVECGYCSFLEPAIGLFNLIESEVLSNGANNFYDTLWITYLVQLFRFFK